MEMPQQEVFFHQIKIFIESFFFTPGLQSVDRNYVVKGMEKKEVLHI